MSKLTDVIAAMHSAGGGAERLTAKWLDLSGEHKGLRDALLVVFKRRPTTQRLGLWLCENVGTRHGKLELVGRHSAHSKAWRYAVRSDGQVAAGAAARAEAARLATERMVYRDAETARFQAEQAQHASAGLTIQVQAPVPAPAPLPPPPPASPPPEVLGTTTIDDTGRPSFKPLLDKDGLPIPARKPAQAPKPAEPVRPMNRIEELRRRYLEHHVGSVPAPGGFDDPGGIVSHNMNVEHVGFAPWDLWRAGGPNWQQRL